MNVLTLENIGLSVQPHFWSRRQQILHDVSLTVEGGAIYGFLGPNGAGKTTTIKTFLGLMIPDRGNISVLAGRISDPKVRRRIGFMPERAYYPDHLTAYELVLQHAMLAGLSYREGKKRSREITALVGLEKAAFRKLGAYSKGMLQRVGLAQAIVGDPDFIVLDEPMSGLDPVGRRDMRELIRDLQARGKTIFFSTHILPDVELICDRVAMLIDGRIRRTGSVEELLEGSVAGVEITIGDCSDELRAELKSDGVALDGHSGHWVLRADDHAHANRIVDNLRRRDITVEEMQIVRASLEEVFMREAHAATNSEGREGK